jgi:hypothetical protein
MAARRAWQEGDHPALLSPHGVSAAAVRDPTLEVGQRGGGSADGSKENEMILIGAVLMVGGVAYDNAFLVFIGLWCLLIGGDA